MIGWLKKATVITLAVSGFFIVGSKGYVLLNDNLKNDLLKNSIEGSGLIETEHLPQQIITKLPENGDDGDFLFEETVEEPEDYTSEKHDYDYVSDNLHEIKKRDADNFENLSSMQRSNFTCDSLDFGNKSYPTAPPVNMESFVQVTVNDVEMSANNTITLSGEVEVEHERLIKLTVTNKRSDYDFLNEASIKGTQKREKILDFEIGKTQGVLTERYTEVVWKTEESSKSRRDDFGDFCRTVNRKEYSDGVTKITNNDCKNNGLVSTGNETIHKSSNTNTESRRYNMIDNDLVEKYTEDYTTTANGTAHLSRIERINATFSVTTSVHTLYNSSIEGSEVIFVFGDGYLTEYPMSNQTTITDSKVVTAVSINFEKNITTTESIRTQTKTLKIRINDSSPERCQFAIFRNSTVKTDTYVVYVSNPENKTITEENKWITIQNIGETEKLCGQQKWDDFSKRIITRDHFTKVVSGKSENESRKRTVFEVEKTEEKKDTTMDDGEGSVLIKERSSLKEFPLEV